MNLFYKKPRRSNKAKSFLPETQLEQALCQWMKGVKAREQASGSRYAFTCKRSDWTGGADGCHFEDGRAVVEAIRSRGVRYVRAELEFYSDEEFVVMRIRNPYYFTWAVVYANLCVDEELSAMAGELKSHLAEKLNEIHPKAFQSLKNVIGSMPASKEDVDVRDKEIEALKVRIASLEAENESLREEQKQDFAKQLAGYVEASGGKSAQSRTSIKIVMLDMINDLGLHEYISDDMKTRISSLDSETPNIINVHAGGQYVKEIKKQEIKK